MSPLTRKFALTISVHVRLPLSQKQLVRSLQLWAVFAGDARIGKGPKSEDIYYAGRLTMQATMQL